MHWNTVRPVLKSLVGTCSGLSTQWLNEPRDFAWTAPDIAAICLLSVTSVIDLATSEILQLPSGSNQIQESYISWKRITITVRVESDVHTDTENAEFFIEQIRAKLQFRSSRDVLASVNCATNEIFQSVSFGVRTDGRERSHVAFDWVLNCRAEMTDPEPLDTIGSVEISGLGTLIVVES